jgi:hypothetical protein
MITIIVEETLSVVSKNLNNALTQYISISATLYANLPKFFFNSSLTLQGTLDAIDLTNIPLKTLWSILLEVFKVNILEVSPI